MVSPPKGQAACGHLLTPWTPTPYAYAPLTHDEADEAIFRREQAPLQLSPLVRWLVGWSVPILLLPGKSRAWFFIQLVFVTCDICLDHCATFSLCYFFIVVLFLIGKEKTTPVMRLKSSGVWHGISKAVVNRRLPSVWVATPKMAVAVV
jgi:hypothetical protein